MGVVGSGTASAARRIHYANFVMSVPGQFCKGGNEGEMRGRRRWEGRRVHNVYSRGEVLV